MRTRTSFFGVSLLRALALAGALVALPCAAQVQGGGGPPPGDGPGGGPGMQGPRDGPPGERRGEWGRRRYMSDDERRAMRQDIRRAGEQIYPDGPRRGPPPGPPPE